MIIRIVKMTFQPERLQEFFRLFEKQQARIREFEGCLHLELWQDLHDQRVCFTHSHWMNEDALQAYRQSPFFRETWQQTKVLFAEKPEAWTLTQRYGPQDH